MTTIAAPTQTTVTGGVDSHKDTHHAVVLDGNGGRPGDRQFPASTGGYRQLLDWMAGFGVIDRIGIESTGSYAAGPARSLAAAGVDVVEANTPHKHLRAHMGKDDAIDAEAAARKVIAGESTTRPKDTTSIIESIRLLTVACASAVNTRAKLMVQIHDLLIIAPASLREQVDVATTRGKPPSAPGCARIPAASTSPCKRRNWRCAASPAASPPSTTRSPTSTPISSRSSPRLHRL